MVNALIQYFSDKGFSYDLCWRNYANSKRQFTFKNLDINYELDVLATATVLTRKNQINIEVHGGKFHVNNQFVYNNETTAEELDELVQDVNIILKGYK